MAFKVIRVGEKPNTVLKEYLCDTVAELQELPKNLPFGTAALVLETGDVYVLNGKGNWVVL